MAALAGSTWMPVIQVGSPASATATVCAPPAKVTGIFTTAAPGPQALACLRAMGVGIADMRTYQANRARGHEAAGEQRDLLLRHAERIEAQIATLQVHLEYLRAKATLWDARDHGDACAEAEASLRVQDMYPRLEEVLR